MFDIQSCQLISNRLFVVKCGLVSYQQLLLLQGDVIVSKKPFKRFYQCIAACLLIKVWFSSIHYNAMWELLYPSLPYPLSHLILFWNVFVSQGFNHYHRVKFLTWSWATQSYRNGRALSLISSSNHDYLLSLYGKLWHSSRVSSNICLIEIEYHVWRDVVFCNSTSHILIIYLKFWSKIGW